MWFVQAISMVVIVVGTVLAADTAPERYAVPKGGGVPLYGHAERVAGEHPTTQVKSGRRLRIVGETPLRYRVRVSDELSGWVDKSEVTLLSSSMHVTFDAKTVQGWLERPRVVAIVDGSEPPQEGILLDRSFGDVLRDNTDRATVERMVGTK